MSNKKINFHSYVGNFYVLNHPGDSAIFRQEYTDHHKQIVKVIDITHGNNYSMLRILAGDGWTGHAYPEELLEV